MALEFWRMGEGSNNWARKDRSVKGFKELEKLQDFVDSNHFQV